MPRATDRIRAGGIVVSWQKAAVIALALMIVVGAGLRLKGLGAVGFAEDEINKVDAARAYERCAADSAGSNISHRNAVIR